MIQINLIHEENNLTRDFNSSEKIYCLFISKSILEDINKQPTYFTLYF